MFFFIFTLMFTPIYGKQEAEVPLPSQSSPKKSGFINIQEIVQKSKALQQVEKKLNEIAQDFQKKMKQANDNLLKEDNQLKSLENSLDPKAYQKRRADFAERVTAFNKEVANKENKLQEIKMAANEDFERVLTDIISQLGTEHGLKEIVPQQTLLFANPDFWMDLTQEALNRLNESWKEWKSKLLEDTLLTPQKKR